VRHVHGLADEGRGPGKLPVADALQEHGVLGRLLAVHGGHGAEGPRPAHHDRQALERVDQPDARDRDEWRRPRRDRGAVAEEVPEAALRAAAVAGHALVVVRACVAVVARRAVGLCRVRAAAGGRIAGAGVVALILGSADDGVRARAAAALAGVGLGARVAVAAGGAVGLGRVRALAGRGIAGAGVVALIL